MESVLLFIGHILFIIAGHILGPRRKSMSPKNLEALLFLRSNSMLWGMDDVHDIVNEKEFK